MQRLGSYDINVGEASPLLWQNNLLLLETIHIRDATTKGKRVPPPPVPGVPPLPPQNVTYLRIRRFGNGANSSTSIANALVVPKIPGSEGVSFGSARVLEGAVWVFGTRNNTQIVAFSSGDPLLVRWNSSVAKHMPRGYLAYNTDVTAGALPGQYVMAVELGAPRAVVHTGNFMTAFWTTTSVGGLGSGWELMPPERYGLWLNNSEGAACPTLR
jgi:hypothetical protein